MNCVRNSVYNKPNKKSTFDDVSLIYKNSECFRNYRNGASHTESTVNPVFLAILIICVNGLF